MTQRYHSRVQTTHDRESPRESTQKFLSLTCMHNNMADLCHVTSYMLSDLFRSIFQPAKYLRAKEKSIRFQYASSADYQPKKKEQRCILCATRPCLFFPANPWRPSARKISLPPPSSLPFPSLHEKKTVLFVWQFIPGRATAIIELQPDTSREFEGCIKDRCIRAWINWGSDMGMGWRGVDAFCKSKHWMDVYLQMDGWRKILWKIGFFRWLEMRVTGGYLYVIVE